MHQAAIDLFQLLVQAGAVPGQDFSCDASEGFHLSERCHSLLQTAYPDINWQEILGDPYDRVRQMIETIHQELGCPFVETIITQMRTRLQMLSDDLAAGYLQAIVLGVESATGIALYPFLLETLDLAEQARLEWLIRLEAAMIPGRECLADLILAAGVSETDYEIVEGEAILTEAGWQRLSLVWDGNRTMA